VSGIADFLRARYDERRQQESAKRRRIPSAFDDHDVEFRYTMDEGEQLLVDGRPFPAEEFWKTASEPAPDPDVIADLDAKLALVDLAERTLSSAEGDSEVDHYGALSVAEETLCLLARPFAGHPDHKGEKWAP
jgi:hypothetical protein